MSIEKIIAKHIKIGDDTNLALTYSDKTERVKNHEIIKSLVNSYISQIESCHDKTHEENLKNHGYTVLENFLNEEEIDRFLEDLKSEPGFNYHIARNAYNPETRTIDKMGDWNILSYEPKIFLKNDVFLKKMTDPKVLSLAQSYLGCFPTLYGINSFVSKYTGENFKIQEIHRDFDDYKFLTFFIYLTDVDSNNGPHIYYKNTQNGDENLDSPVELRGKRGTALVLDGYGYHLGKPLTEGSRIIAWFRIGLSLNKTYLKTENYLYKFDNEFVFENIEENLHNKYLLRGFLDTNNV
jgi:hypothetical protein